MKAQFEPPVVLCLLLILESGVCLLEKTGGKGYEVYGGIRVGARAKGCVGGCRTSKRCDSYLERNATCTYRNVRVIRNKLVVVGRSFLLAVQAVSCM